LDFNDGACAVAVLDALGHNQDANEFLVGAVIHTGGIAPKFVDGNVLESLIEVSNQSLSGLIELLQVGLEVICEVLSNLAQVLLGGFSLGLHVFEGFLGTLGVVFEQPLATAGFHALLVKAQNIAWRVGEVEAVCSAVLITVRVHSDVLPCVNISLPLGNNGLSELEDQLAQQV